MKNFSKTLMIAVLIFSAVFSMNAQDFKKSDFTVFLGGSMPVGQFNKGVDLIYTVSPENTPFETTLGHAMFGANLGLRYTYRFDIGVGAFVNADLIWNALDEEIREEYNKISKTKPMYLNIPFMVGADYRYDFSYEFGVFAEAGMGINLFKKTTEGWSASDSHPEGPINYDLSKSFAYEIGTGIMIANTLSIGIHFYGLGNHELKPTNSTDYTLVYNGEPEAIEKVNMFMIKLGFHF
jgi:opacity protein-like surface antigen